MANRLQDKAFAVWINKDQQAEKPNSDAKKTTAFERVRAILGDIQDKEKPVKETMQEIQKSLDAVSGEQKLSKSQTKVLNALFKQLQEMLTDVQTMVHSLEGEAGKVTGASGASEDTDSQNQNLSKDNGDPESYFNNDPASLTSGWQAMAQSIMVKLQAEFNKLNGIYNTMKQRIVQNSNAMVTVGAAVAKDMGVQEANIYHSEEYASMTQAGTSAISALNTARSMNSVSKEVKPQQDQLNAMKAFQADVNDPNGEKGAIVVGDAKPQFSSQKVQNYYTQLEKGNFIKPTGAGALSDKEIQEVHTFIRTNPNQCGDIMKQVSQKSMEASSQIQTAYSRNTQWEQLVNSGMQMVNSSVTAAMKGMEAGYATKKAGDDAAKGTNQVLLDQNNTSAKEMGDHAQEVKQDAQKAMSVREAIQQYNEYKRGG